MSLSKPDKQLLVEKGLLFPLIAVILPGTYLVLLSRFIQSMFDIPEPFPWFYLLFVLLVGTIQVLFFGIAQRYRLDFAQRLRELFFLMFLVALVLFLSESGDAGRRIKNLYSDMKNILAFVLVMIEWIASYYIMQLLKNRVEFLRAVQRKNNIELVNIIRENPDLAKISIESLKKLRHSIQSMLISVFLISFVFVFIRERFTLPTAGIFLTFTVLCMSILVFLNNIIYDQRLMAEGIRIAAGLKRKRSYYLWGFLAIILIVGFVLSFQTLGVAEKLAVGLVNWLSSLNPTTFRGGEIPVSTMIQRPPLPRSLFDSHGQGGDSIWARIFLSLVLGVQLLFVVLLVGSLIYFIFSPLLSLHLKSELKKLRPLKVLLAKLDMLRAILRHFLLDFRFWLQRPLRLTAEPPKKGRKPKVKRDSYSLSSRIWRKKAELRRVIYYFNRLITWGRKRGYPYRLHLAPIEYGAALGSLAPGKEGQLAEAMAILEESLFSRLLISEDLTKRYITLINSIVRG